MQVECPNPFKPEDCGPLNDTIRQIMENITLCEKGGRCGLPVEEYLESNRRLLKMAQDIKREFFPLQS